MNDVKLKPYLKIITRNCQGVCAIYEPHPFRSGAISEAVGTGVDTGINDTEWCWVYYDWCGNPIGLSDGMPDGELVEKFTQDNIGSESLAEYLNKENEEFVEIWYKSRGER